MEGQHWTKKLPWWVGWAFAGGFGLAGAFGSSVLPVNFQLAAFIAGCILLLVAATGTVAHFVNEYRKAQNLRRIKLEPIHLIIIGLLIAASGVSWLWYSKPLQPSSTTASTSVSPRAPTSMPARGVPLITNATVQQGYSLVVLELTGTYARTGKNITYVVEAQIDAQDRGNFLQHAYRFRINKATEFFTGESVKIPIASYLKKDRSSSFMQWGGEEVDNAGVENGSFQTTWFFRASIIAITEDGAENRVISFTLFPKISQNEVMNNPDLLNIARRWQNVIIYPEGALRALEPQR
jgi:hypothetical protein